MEFEIYNTSPMVVGEPRESTWAWRLWDDGDEVWCRSGGEFGSVASAREDVAAFQGFFDFFIPVRYST